MKKTLKIVLFVGVLLPLAAFAQDAAAAVTAQPEGAVGFVNKLIDQLQAKAPWLAAVMGIMAALRLSMKPLFEVFHNFVKATPSEWDDKLLAKVESSKALSITLKVLDYVASVKLIHPNTGK